MQKTKKQKKKKGKKTRNHTNKTKQNRCRLLCTFAGTTSFTSNYCMKDDQNATKLCKNQQKYAQKNGS